MGNQPFSSHGGGNRSNRKFAPPKGPRKNDRIRLPEIRVIGPDGRQIGIMKTRDALDLARQAGLDLIEISPNAKPPVCRIVDYGKYMYEQSKRDKEKKSSTSASKMKEVKFRVRIEQHDYMTKLRNAERFLNKGNKLKLTLTFKGREMDRTDDGFVIVKRAIADLEHISKADSIPRLVGRNITLTMSPLPASKRVLKYTADASDEEEIDDDDEEEGDEDENEDGTTS